MADNSLAPQALLQRRILQALAVAPARSATLLATRLTAPRPSVSRAVHSLERGGLITRADRYWTLTPAGQTAALQAEAEISRAVTEQRARLEVLEARARLARLQGREHPTMADTPTPGEYLRLAAEGLDLYTRVTALPTLDAQIAAHKAPIRALCAAAALTLPGLTEQERGVVVNLIGVAFVLGLTTGQDAGGVDWGEG